MIKHNQQNEITGIERTKLTNCRKDKTSYVWQLKREGEKLTYALVLNEVQARIKRKSYNGASAIKNLSLDEFVYNCNSRPEKRKQVRSSKFKTNKIKMKDKLVSSTLDLHI